MECVCDVVAADCNDYVIEMRNRMEKVFNTVREQLGQAFKQAYDGRVKKLQFKIGDGVVLLPQVTASSGAEMAIADHRTLVCREDTQLC